MKRLVKIFLVLLVLGGLLAGGAWQARSMWMARNKPHFRQVEVKQGDISSSVDSTGTVQPTLRVQIGSVVSGPVDELFVDFNSVVKQDQLLAKIDERLPKAAVARAKALLDTRKAEVVRVEALKLQAENDLDRAKELQAIHEDYISDSEMDQVRCNYESVEAQLEVANANVQQAQASLDDAEYNLAYTDIKSPVDGIVIDRLIDPGQTLAASFQTPVLFIVAPDLDKKVHVYASVDEADIGLIREAQKQEKEVHFTVDAYPDDLFEGKIHQVRVNPTSEQNVVIYPVIIEAPNPEMKLLPGMTADISFAIETREDVIMIPNAALRFYPNVGQVHPDDRKVLEGAAMEAAEDDASAGDRSAQERAEANKKRNKRHVWTLDKKTNLLRAVEVETGISSYRYTELVSTELKEGQKLVTGIGTSAGDK